MVHLVGICFDVGDIKYINNSKSQNELKKRQISIVDNTLQPMVVILWNSVAADFDEDLINKIILIQNAIVKDHNGRKFLTQTNNTLISEALNLKIGEELKSWYENGGKNKVTSMICKLAFPNVN